MLRLIRIPRVETGLMPLLLVAAGFILIWIVVCGIVIGIGMAIMYFVARGRTESPGDLYAAGLLLGFVLAIVWALAVDRWLRRRSMHRAGHRQDRLERLATHPTAAARVPHRLIELAYRRHLQRSFQFEGRLRLACGRVLADAGEGWLIVVRGPKTAPPPLPAPSDAAFEPINPAEPDEQLVWLLRRSYPDAFADETAKAASERSVASRRRGILTTLRRVAARIATLLGWAWLAWIVYAMLFPRRVPGGWVYRIIFVWLLLLPFLWHLVRGRTWWLVPGGVVYRDHRLWRKRVVVGLLTWRGSSVMIDVDGTAYFSDRGRLRRYHWGRADRKADAAGVAALLAAWLSTARTPTREEVLAFMGPDAEWANDTSVPAPPR